MQKLVIKLTVNYGKVSPWENSNYNVSLQYKICGTKNHYFVCFINRKCCDWHFAKNEENFNGKYEKFTEQLLGK